MSALVLAVLLATPLRLEGERAEEAPPAGTFATLGPVLARADVVGEATAVTVTSLGHGIEVVRVDFTRVLKGGDAETGAPRSAVVLAAPGDFTAGSEYLLFLDRFRGGERFTWIERLARGERDYDAKVKVLTQFIEIEAIADAAARSRKLRDVLIDNLDDRELFVKWNALRELTGLAERQPALFGDAERAAVVRVYYAEASPTFRKGLLDVLRSIGVPLEEKGS
jgi:hypothetical protein